MDEFKRFSIPVKWRKWIWVGVIGLLTFAIKFLVSWIIRLDKKLDDCQHEKTELMKSRQKADSILMYKFMERALQQADQEIIQPKIDSLKSEKS